MHRKKATIKRGKLLDKKKESVQTVEPNSTTNNQQVDMSRFGTHNVPRYSSVVNKTLSHICTDS